MFAGKELTKEQQEELKQDLNGIEIEIEEIETEKKEDHQSSLGFSKVF